MHSLRNKAYDALRWSEKYVQADMVYIAKNNFWQILGQIATSFISLALTVVFANYLPKETYGLYRYILSIASILGVFTLTGMNQAVNQAVAVGNESALRVSVRYQLKWSVLQFIAFSLLGLYYFSNGNGTLAVSLWILSASSPLTAAFNTYGAYLAGKKEFRLSNVLSIISTATYAGSIMSAVFLNGNVIWLIVAYALSTLGSTSIFYILTLRKFKPPAGEAREALKYGRELTFIDLIAPITSQIDKIILTHFWGATQLAIYSLAMAVPDKASIFIKNWVNIGMPKFASKTPEEMDRVFYTRIFQGLIIGTICAIGYVALSPYLFKYLLPKYLDALFYSQLLSISFIFAMPNRYIGIMMASQKLSRLIFFSGMTQNVIRILSYATLGILGGLMGLVAAQVLNSLVGMIINIIAWRSFRD